MTIERETAEIKGICSRESRRLLNQTNNKKVTINEIKIYGVISDLKVLYARRVEF